MRIKQFIVTCITLSFLGSALIAPAQAAVLGTQAYLQAADRQANLATVGAALSRDDVQQRLTELGVDPADALARVARLPDVDLAKLAAEIDSLPAGGDSVLAIVGLVFVILLILEVTGVIDIFKGN